jgi:hypothetical protein
LMSGERPFFVQEGQLCLTLRPILPAWMFDENNNLSFKFLGRVTVNYHNPRRIDTFNPGCIIQSMIVHPFDSDAIELKGVLLPAPYAQQVRDGRVRQIDVYFA